MKSPQKRIKKIEKKRKKNMNKNNKPHFSDRIDTIILPLVCLKVQEEFYLPIHHTVYFDCPTVKTWPVLCVQPIKVHWPWNG